MAALFAVRLRDWWNAYDALERATSTEALGTALVIDVLVVVRPAAPIQGAAALVKAPPLRRASRLGGVGRDGRKSSRNRGSARAVAPLDAARRAPRPAQIARPVVAGREPRRTPAVARLRDTRAAAGDDLVRGEDGRRRSW